tara:strand:- start:205 stop:588 length:384 start_codon:yes stop_codon:yes gene_type:complete
LEAFLKRKNIGRLRRRSAPISTSKPPANHGENVVLQNYEKMHFLRLSFGPLQTVGHPKRLDRIHIGIGRGIGSKTGEMESKSESSTDRSFRTRPESLKSVRKPLETVKIGSNLKFGTCSDQNHLHRA